MNYDCSVLKPDTSQRDLIGLALLLDGRTWNDVIKCTLTDDQLELPLPPWHNVWCFTVWTADRVYFPGKYEGDELHFVASVPRYPCEEKTDEVGGQPL